MFDVTVVPMFSPITRAMPWYIGNTPVEQSIIVIAITAADDCTHIVSTLPITRNVIVVKKLLGSKLEKKSNTGWLCERSMSMPVCRRVPSPRNIKEMPKIKSPNILRFLLYISNMAIKKAGHTKSVMLNEKPALIIHAVSVVPIFAPIITEMACAKVSSPAFTNDTVITVVAVDDCTAAVMSAPDRIPVKRLVVIVPNTCRNCGPAIFCKLSLIDFIPNISRARAPINLKNIQTDIYTLF